LIEENATKKKGAPTCDVQIYAQRAWICLCRHDILDPAIGDFDQENAMERWRSSAQDKGTLKPPARSVVSAGISIKSQLNYSGCLSRRYTGMTLLSFDEAKGHDTIARAERTAAALVRVDLRV
jgi:hypothetical protein